MAHFDVPLDIAVEQWPPESVGEGAACGVVSLVAKAVMCVVDEGEAEGRCNIKLVSSIVLQLPEPVICYCKACGSAKEVGQCFAMKMSRRTGALEVFVDEQKLILRLCSRRIWGKWGRGGGVALVIGHGIVVVGGVVAGGEAASCRTIVVVVVVPVVGVISRREKVVGSVLL
jgi:hypothetical protein